MHEWKTEELNRELVLNVGELQVAVTVTVLACLVAAVVGMGVIEVIYSLFPTWDEAPSWQTGVAAIVTGLALATLLYCLVIRRVIPGFLTKQWVAERSGVAAGPAEGQE